jgi:ribonuclease P protein component
METERRFTLSKDERLYLREDIEALFMHSSASFPVYPLRVIYRWVEAEEGAGSSSATASILVSVPKKRFKRAVKRNRVKRQVREAYRKQKHLLIEPLAARGLRVHIAFVWLDPHLHPSSEVETKVRKLLLHIVDKLTAL